MTSTEWPWVGVSVPETLVSAPLRQTLMLFAGGGLLLFLIGLGVAVFLARRLAQPITQLADAAQALGAGHSVMAVHPGIAEINWRASENAASNSDSRPGTTFSMASSSTTGGEHAIACAVWVPSHHSVSIAINEGCPLRFALFRTDEDERRLNVRVSVTC